MNKRHEKAYKQAMRSMFSPWDDVRVCKEEPVQRRGSILKDASLLVVAIVVSSIASAAFVYYTLQPQLYKVGGC